MAYDLNPNELSVVARRLKTYGVSEMGIAQLLDGQPIANPKDRQIIAAIAVGAVASSSFQSEAQAEKIG